MTDRTNFSDAARAAAQEILAEYAGKAYLSDLIAIAYMRGLVQGVREAGAVVARVDTQTAVVAS